VAIASVDASVDDAEHQSGNLRYLKLLCRTVRGAGWRPAVAARNRSPREVRDPARQALRPGCEELAERDPDAGRSFGGGGCSVTEKRGPGAENRHGGAPRGERPASWDARRLASA
jgi:hypothetical protein